MRSRPDVSLFLRPATPTPGTRVEAEVVLESRSDTPINGVEAHLRGVEQRHGRTATVGSATLPQYAQHWHVDLVARAPQAMLTRGEHRFKFVFEIPRSAPPEYRSQTAKILYNLNVVVDIPWWPNREARYLLPVVAEASLPDATPAPTVFCTDTRGPKDEALYIEASLDTAAIPVGGVIRGAVSLANVAHHRVRRVDLALVQLEHMAHRPESAVEEGHRYVVHLHEGPPADGQAISFQVRLPADAAVSFAGALLEVRWYLEVRAVIALGSDVTLAIPFRAYRTAGAVDVPGATLGRVPPVGKSRRALVWAECARRNGLANDAENERMSTTLGDVSLAITLEPRKAGGLALTGALTWPRLGIDLAVTERRWVDVWSRGACDIAVADFQERFTARGREAPQVLAFLDEETCKSLVALDEAAVGDEGATLMVTNAAQDVDLLDGSVARIKAAARALADAADRVTPPVAMAAFVPAWVASASSLGGRFHVGDMSIREAAFDESSLTIATQWSDEGLPAATMVRFPLPEHRGDVPEEPRPLDGAARAIVQSLEPLAAVAVTARAVEARLPGAVEDPARLEPLLTGLGRLTRMLSGGEARGPYR